MAYQHGMTVTSGDLESARKLCIDQFEVWNVIEKHVPRNRRHRPCHRGLVGNGMRRGAAVEEVQTLAFELLHDAAHGFCVLRQETAGMVVESAYVRYRSERRTEGSVELARPHSEHQGALNFSYQRSGMWLHRLMQYQLLPGPGCAFGDLGTRRSVRQQRKRDRARQVNHALRARYTIANIVNDDGKLGLG